MILEIIGAKLISPVFGLSHFVWMSQITITLLSISFGSYLSSFIKNENLTFLFSSIIISSLYSIITNIFFQEISFGLLHLPFIYAASLTSFVLYFIPLTCLGLIFPIITEEIKKISNNRIGKISALSTIGSVFGTLISGAVLIRWFNNQTILLYTSFFIIFWSLIYLFLKDKKRFNLIIKFIFMLVLVSILFVFKRNNLKNDIKLIEKKNSNFGEILVIEDKNYKLILNEGLVQINYDYILNKSAHYFTYALKELTLLSRPNVKNVLHIGLGAGVVPTEFQKRGIDNTVVEINPTMLDVAKKHYNYDDIKIKTIIQDGRFFIKTSNKKYDAIILDAFLVDSVPVFLLTKEAFQEMKNLLNKNGIIVINSFGSVNPPSILTKSINKTLKSVFKNVNCYSLNEFNVFFTSSDGDIHLRNFTDYSEVHPDVVENLKRILSTKMYIDDIGGILMSDNSNLIEIKDNSPTELFRKKNNNKILQNPEH